MDLILLDINLPGEDGLQLARSLRVKLDVGIILVTGRTDEVDRIVGLEIGADDYVTKPFNQRELLARVKILLRRISAAQKSRSIDLPIRRLDIRHAPQASGFFGRHHRAPDPGRI